MGKLKDHIKTDYNKRALTIVEAAKYAGVSRGTINFWIRSGKLPFENLPTKGKFYKMIRIRKEDLDKFLESFYSTVKGSDGDFNSVEGVWGP